MSEEGGESEAVLRASPRREATAEFVNQFVPNTYNSSSLSRTHADLTSNNSPPTAAWSRYSAGQLPPIMLSPQQCKSMGRTTFLGLRHGPSSPQPQPPAGERGGQMEGGRGGGKGPREKRALNRERDVLHLLIAHGTADCRKVFAAQSHKHKHTKTYIHTCICTYRYLQHSHTSVGGGETLYRNMPRMSSTSHALPSSRQRAASPRTRRKKRTRRRRQG